MKKLTPISFIYNRFPTEEEKEKEWYFINKETGLISQSQGGFTQLNRDHTITLQEAKELYNRIQFKIGETITRIEIDLTKYYEYKENGEPVLGSEENPEAYGTKITAFYEPKYNRLRILENHVLVYENYNG